MRMSHEEEESPNVVGNIAIVFMSILLIAVGGAMRFTNVVKMVYFCYGAGACLLIWGIWMISRYFLHKEFRHTTNYGFSVGTLVVILGAIDLIRAQEVAASIPNYLGILVLIEGVVMLQNTVQLKNLKGHLWAVSLVFSILSVAFSIVILLNAFDFLNDYEDLFYLLLIVVGMFALLSLCFVGIRTNRYHKEEEREYSRQMQDSEEWFSTARIIAEDPMQIETDAHASSDGNSDKREGTVDSSDGVKHSSSETTSATASTALNTSEDTDPITAEFDALVEEEDFSE